MVIFHSYAIVYQRVCKLCLFLLPLFVSHIPFCVVESKFFPGINQPNMVINMVINVGKTRINMLVTFSVAKAANVDPHNSPCWKFMVRRPGERWWRPPNWKLVYNPLKLWMYLP